MVCSLQQPKRGTDFIGTTMSSNNKPFNRTRTFLMKKSPPPPYHPEKAQTSPNRVEFPTSPQPGKEIVHFSHPHALYEFNLPHLFTCAGCKEYGAGKRFSCLQCDFQLHDFCIMAPPVLNAHPFHSHHQLQFYSKPGSHPQLSQLTVKPCFIYT